MSDGDPKCHLCYGEGKSQGRGQLHPCQCLHSRVMDLTAERDQLREQADHFEDRLDRERLDHEETKGYRAHAEAERDQLRAERDKLRAADRLLDEIERLNRIEVAAVEAALDLDVAMQRYGVAPDNAIVVERAMDDVDGARHALRAALGPAHPDPNRKDP